MAARKSAKKVAKKTVSGPARRGVPKPQTRPVREDRDVEKGYSRAQFAAKLRRLADSIETARAFSIQVAGERFRIPATAVFNIEHERSGSREEIEFQLIWDATA